METDVTVTTPVGTALVTVTVPTVVVPPMKTVVGTVTVVNVTPGLPAVKVVVTVGGSSSTVVVPAKRVVVASPTVAVCSGTWEEGKAEICFCARASDRIKGDSNAQRHSRNL